MIRTWCLTWCNIRTSTEIYLCTGRGSPGAVGRAVCSWNCNRCLLEKDGGVVWHFRTDYFQKQHPPPSVWFSLSAILQKLHWNSNVIKWSCSVCIGLFSLYIWFVAGCMFKLYHCCSLYSVLIFLCASTGWNGTKPVCFSEEIFSHLHKSCLAVLKAEPWTVCTVWWTLPRAGWHLGQCLPAALKGFTPCAAGGPQEWAGQWVK